MKLLKYNNAVKEVKPIIYEDYIKNMTIEEANQNFDSYSAKNGEFEGIKEDKGIINTLEIKNGISIATQYDSNVPEDIELKAIEYLRNGGRSQKKTGEIIGKSQSYVSKKEQKIKKQKNKLIT